MGMLRRTRLYSNTGAVLFLGMLVACSDVGEPPPFVMTPGGLSDLEQTSGTEWLVRFDKVTGLNEFAKPVKPLAPLSGDPVAACAAFLARFPAVFGASSLGELEGTLQEPEEDGTNTIRFRQRVGSVLARDVTVTMFLNEIGAIEFVTGSAVPQLAQLLPITPSLDANAAKEVARKAAPLAQELGSADLFADSGHTKGRVAPQLLYQVTAGDEVIVISANSGQVLTKIPLTQSGNKEVKSPGLDGLERAIEVNKTKDSAGKDSYEMRNSDKYHISVGKPVSPELTSLFFNELLITSDPKAWSTDEALSQDAVEVYFNVTRTLKHMKSKLKWDYSSKTKENIRSVVRENCDPGNAFAKWAKSTLTFCVPGPVTLRGSEVTMNSAHSLDVTAHEVFHLVTNTLAADASHTWASSAEGGALSEGLSDAFGEFTSLEYGVGSPAVDSDGSVSTRSWIKPHTDNALSESADDIDEIGTGAHFNSTLVTQPWYLMTFGGEHYKSKLEVWNTLSPKDSENLWWETSKKALSADVTLSKFASTQMEIAKKKKLDLQTVGCAWAAVKVISKDDLKKLWDVQCDNTFTCANQDDGFYCFSKDKKAHKGQCEKHKLVAEQRCKVNACTTRLENSNLSDCGN
jgi:Zn-dependent metalloprotease